MIYFQGLLKLLNKEFEQNMLEDAEFKQGDIIGGQHKVVKILGQGAFGTVYLAQQLQNHSFYAVKILNRDLLNNQEILNRFNREAQILISLADHPNIIKTILINKIAGRTIIVMEYIPPSQFGGNTLRSIIKKADIDLIWRRRAAEQICSGMTFAFQNGLKAHRDLKPENLLLGVNPNTNSTEIKISDFGISGILSTPIMPIENINIKDHEFLTQHGSTIGTPLYLAPEQIKDASLCDERSDLYSFGIILYELFSYGKIPYSFNSYDELLKAHLNLKIHEFNSPFFEIIQKCLSKNRNARFESFAELKEAIQETSIDKQQYVFFRSHQSKRLTEDYIARASSLCNIGNLKEAQEMIEIAIEKEATNPAAWTMRGLIAEAKGEKNLALEYFNYSIQLGPSTEAYQGISNLLQESNPEKALEFIILALQNQKGQHWELHLSKANIHCKLSQGREALAELDKAEIISPHNSQIFLAKASIYSLIFHNYAEAILLNLKVLEIEPNFHKAMGNIANSYLELENYHNALKFAETAISTIQSLGVNSSDDEYSLAVYYYHKARAQNGLKNKGDAIKSLNIALGISKTIHRIWFLAGEIYHEIGEDTKALYYINESIKLTNDKYFFITYSNRMARILLEQSRFDEASSFIINCLKCDSTNSESLELRRLLDAKESPPKSQLITSKPGFLKKLFK
jgi:serine/threonine protein kinase